MKRAALPTLSGTLHDPHAGESPLKTAEAARGAPGRKITTPETPERLRSTQPCPETIQRATGSCSTCATPLHRIPGAAPVLKAQTLHQAARDARYTLPSQLTNSQPPSAQGRAEPRRVALGSRDLPHFKPTPPDTRNARAQHPPVALRTRSTTSHHMLHDFGGLGCGGAREGGLGGVVTVGIFEEDVTRTHNVSLFVPVDSKGKARLGDQSF